MKGGKLPKGHVSWPPLIPFSYNESFKFFFFRKLLFTVGEETGRSELNALKTQLSSMEVGKRDLDKILDVWDCLDLMEERLEDGELISLLKSVYRDDDKLPGLLGDYTRGTCISNTTHAYIEQMLFVNMYRYAILYNIRYTGHIFKARKSTILRNYFEP